MHTLERRSFLKLLTALGAGTITQSSYAIEALSTPALPHGQYHPGRVENEYTLFLPGEKESIRSAPKILLIANGVVTATSSSHSAELHPNDYLDDWRLITILNMNGVDTAVFEKHVTHRGAIAYVTVEGGVIAYIPKQIGDLSKIRPRPTNTPHGIRLKRTSHYVPGPDITGEYLLKSADDPCYENVAALGAEYIGWTLVANQEAGPLRSLYLDADGKSREISLQEHDEGLWAPDQVGAAFDPSYLFPGENPQLYQYQHGYSKRTLLGGYLPVANIGVWNPTYNTGYETTVLLPPGENATPIARVHSLVPDDQLDLLSSNTPVYRDENGAAYVDRYWNGSREQFYTELAGIWNTWHSLHEDNMSVDIPDEWLLNAARAGITLSRCSYRGLHPTYQIGEGAYTKIPERSHALFPVAHYEFIWAQQLWNLTKDADAYFQFYLDNYILPDGNFLYNTQDQVEAPLNAGVFLATSARSYFYNHDLDSLQKRLPVLRRMTDFVLSRYEYSKNHFPPSDRRYGLIWGSPEADLGDPHNDFPESHPYYYQNAVWIWRGLVEQSKCLRQAGVRSSNATLTHEAESLQTIAAEMRINIERSLAATQAAGNSEMRSAGISPFTTDDVDRKPTQLSSYENHRFMQDWFLADWGNQTLDHGHLKHREIAGEQILGLHTDGAVARTSNFMEHGTLSVKIRQDDYRPFLLTLYALVCYAADSGSRYAPEDAYIPGGTPGEGNPYQWSAVINSTLQPTIALRWLLCYEENDHEICHLQKAAPKHWFSDGQVIAVSNCPTRFGTVSWTTRAIGNHKWLIILDVSTGFSGDIAIHIHPDDGHSLSKTSMGSIESMRETGAKILLTSDLLSGKTHIELEAS